MAAHNEETFTLLERNYKMHEACLALQHALSHWISEPIGKLYLTYFMFKCIISSSSKWIPIGGNQQSDIRSKPSYIRSSIEPSLKPVSLNSNWLLVPILLVWFKNISTSAYSTSSRPCSAYMWPLNRSASILYLMMVAHKWHFIRV